MVHTILIYNFKKNLLEWDSYVVPINYPVFQYIQINISKLDMKQVVIQTPEPASTKDYTKKIINVFTLPMGITTLKIILTLG